MDLRKNTIIKGTIQDLNDDCQGVLNTNGTVVFVPFALPGEEIEGIIINTKSKFAIAKVTKLNTESSTRTPAPCPYYFKCGGCDLQHLKKENQLEFKTLKVKKALKRNAKIEHEVLPCISANDFRYRNKIALPISPCGEMGLYRKNTHSILPITDCLITQEWNKKLIKVINDYISQSKVTIYNEDTKQGILKQVVARNINDTLLVTMVITENDLPKSDLLIKLLNASFKKFGLNLNINKLNNNVILSNNWKKVYGTQELLANEEGIAYPVSNASFFQVNNEIKTLIYKKVLELIDPSSTVIDAYSGAGLLSAIISKKAKKCYGVEIVPEATENANKLKINNNLHNLENINGDCTTIIPKLVKNIKDKDVIITLDPPRKGCDKKVLEAIKSAMPNRIIYISCNPQTLARDLGYLLEDNSYVLSLVQPYDMFPQTSHVETLVCLDKK